jgi:hypothetical protein
MTEEAKTVDQNTAAQAEAPVAEQPAQQESFDLTVQDLNSLKAIIDVAAQRGVFKPSEMAAVGTVYNKLSGFLANVTKGQQNG